MLNLLPEPKRLRLGRGTWQRPERGWICASEDLRSAELLRQALPAWRLTRLAAGEDLSQAIILRRVADRSLGEEGYRLACGRRGILLRAQTERGLFYGVQTLLQILAQSHGRVPCLRIRDWPDFPNRGLYYDVTRGRVPKLERLFELVDRLSHYKLNQLQLYVEHVFTFRKHPRIGAGASPLTPDDLLRLEARCSERHVELVPSLQSFGHMSKVTRHKAYHELCEDSGRGAYVRPPAQPIAAGWTLSPAVPKTYAFLDELYSEFLPLFPSKRFNACCDEVGDLGLGKSFALCKRKGTGRVYLEHLLRIRKLVRRRGKSCMFWGEMIRQYPELLKEVPADVILLNWGYGEHFDFSSCGRLAQAGVRNYCCPGTNSWSTLFPRLTRARLNISRFAAAGKRAGSEGLLNTDWGDDGHFNFLEYSWYGYLFGAEQAWNTRANQASFDRRIGTLFYGDRGGRLVAALRRLGDAATYVANGYHRLPFYTYFRPSSDEVFKKVKASEGRRIVRLVQPALQTLLSLERSRSDASGTIAYLVFAAQTLQHAAHRLQAFGLGGRISAAQRRALGREYAGLRRRFQRLWLARNRPSEIGITLARYDQVAAADYAARRPGSER